MANTRAEVPVVRRVTLRTLALMTALVALTSANILEAGAAQRQVGVSTTANKFSPEAIYAEAGDTVTWLGLEKGHNVEGYAGAGYEKVDSSNESYSTTFEGGTVYYRCTLHSAWSWRDKCTGMCGAITDRSTSPTTPTMATPAGGDLYENPVRFSGQADPWNFVAIYDGNGLELDRFLAGADGSWKGFIRVPMGSHSFAAATINPDGSTSPATTFRTINVTRPGDYTPPSAAFSEKVSVQQGPLTVLRGTAQDALSVETIRVQLVAYQPDPGIRYRPDQIVPIGLDYYPHFATATRNDVATCPNCPSTNVEWSLSLPLPPGYYDAKITVWDTSGNSAGPPPPQRIVFGERYDPPSDYMLRFVVLPKSGT